MIKLRVIYSQAHIRAFTIPLLNMSTKPRAARLGAAATAGQQLTINDLSDDSGGPVGEETGGDDGGEWTVQTNKSRKTKYICNGSGIKVCGLAIRDKDDSISCEGCEGWFHPKCQGIAADAFKALVKFDFIWLCDGCKPTLSSMIQLGKRLEARIDAAEQKILKVLEQSRPKQDVATQLEMKISSMEKTVMGKISEHQEKVETVLQEQNKVVTAIPKYTQEISKSTLDLQKMIKNKEERDGRETNLLLHNISESSSSDPEERKEHDKNNFNKVATALLGDQVKIDTVKIYRLGKRAEPASEHDRTEPRPRLMLVKLTKKEDVQMLMQRRWKLREVGFPNIYLTQDLTPEEREKQKKLREELAAKGRENYRIFQGKVIPRTDRE